MQCEQELGDKYRKKCEELIAECDCEVDNSKNEAQLWKFEAEKFETELQVKSNVCTVHTGRRDKKSS